jgi:hypothetical protein
MASAFVDLLERHHKDGVKFLNHILRATGVKTWVSFVNVESKGQSKQWTNKFTKQAEKD